MYSIGLYLLILIQFDPAQLDTCSGLSLDGRSIFSPFCKAVHKDIFSEQ